MWASAGPGSSSVKQCKSDGRVKKIMKKEATDLAVSQLQCSANAIIASHVPGPHMWASAGPSSSSVKQCKSDGGLKIYNSVSARSPLTKS